MTPRDSILRVCLLAYGVLNSVLYAGLLPLWDGFDEPFHYGYVRCLSDTHRFPVVGRTALPSDIWRSLPLAPASHIVKRNIAAVITFDEYFRLPAERRGELRAELLRVKSETGPTTGGSLNYEAQQAPLAYALMAVVDGGRAHAPLVNRVLLLRILFGSLSALVTGLLTWRLAELLTLPPALRHSVLFVLFSSQVFYATTAHVSNDWLAMPLFTLLLILALLAYREPTPKDFALLGLFLALALLTKASLLALLPFVIGTVLVVLWGRPPGLRGTPRSRPAKGRSLPLLLATCLPLAAPWYTRNFLLYHNLSGIQETVDTPLTTVLQTALHVPWLKTLSAAAQSAIWIGNNSATTFGFKTVAVALALIAFALMLYLLTSIRQAPPSRERILIAGVASYLCGLAYYAVASFRYTNGVGVTFAPWYAEPLEPAVLCLCFLGILRAGLPGRLLAIAITWLGAYMIIATYVVKLIPFYSGHVVEHARFGDLLRYYTRSLPTLESVLATTALFPPRLVLSLTAAVAVAALLLAAAISTSLWRCGPSRPTAR